MTQNISWQSAFLEFLCAELHTDTPLGIIIAFCQIYGNLTFIFLLIYCGKSRRQRRNRVFEEK